MLTPYGTWVGVEEDDDNVVAYAEVRVVELVRYVETKGLELAPLEEHGVEPGEGWI